jgi:hypothetical protein
MYKPRPVPLSDFVANFSNSRGNISESIPIPVSCILIVIAWSLYFSIDILISPFYVNLDALPKRLKITCCILFLSAKVNIFD